MKSHNEDNMSLTLSFGVLEKLMTSFQKDTSDTPSGQLKSLINFVDSHFESFEKCTKVKVQNEFNAKMLLTLKIMIVDDRDTLDTCMKSMQDAMFEGRNIYKSLLSLSKLAEDIEKKCKDHEDELTQI